MINESDTDSGSKTVEAKIKTWITDDRLAIRAMQTDLNPKPNYTNIIVFSNKHNVMPIALNDRRFNIPPRQEEPRRPSDEEYDNYFLESNLQAFADFLSALKVDRAAARTPLLTDAKNEMQTTTTSLTDEIVAHLKAGDFEYFVGHIPTSSGSLSPSLIPYKETLAYIFARLSEELLGERVKIGLTKDELQSIFRYITGLEQASGKFTKALSWHGLSLNTRAVYAVVRKPPLVCTSSSS